MKKLLILTLLLLPAAALMAQVTLARLFSDHAVLQRQKPIPVWGWAPRGETVRVMLGSQRKSAVTDTSGRWQVNFAAMEAGGPYTLSIEASSGKTERSDILIGDVWLCSGQSNMEWTVSRADNFVRESKTADFPQIRHFGVAHEAALEPLSDLPSGKWMICNPENVADFTAVGYFFAREIFQKTGVPIGILHSSWGGSQIEGWISREAMRSSPELLDYASDLPKTWEDADHRLERSIKNKLLGSADANPSLDDEKQYLRADYDCSKWITSDPMWQWDWKGVWAWRGNGYMGKTVEMPGDMIDKITTLGLAENFSFNEVYINGTLVSAGILQGARRILIPANTWKAGPNRLMVKMNKMIEPEWFGLGLMGSDQDLFVSSDKQRISLSGSDWKLMPSFAEPHAFAHSSNNVGTAIYNAMIAPLLPYSIRGVLWYQGEANAGRAYQYRQVFPLLIQDWRRQWKDELPFYFVQLSSYGPYQNSNQGSDWAELREAQTMTLSLPNTGMAVTTDIGNPKDIHPTNKQDVGKRLAAIALKSLYGQNLVAGGPTYESVRFGKDEAVLTFKNIGGGLLAKDKFGYLKGFEIAAEDRVFYYAKAEIEGDKVVVKHPKGMKPVAVRYAWANSPEDANLFNVEGFPACPFRTDSWEELTLKERFRW